MPFQGIDAGPIPAECKKSLLLLFKKQHKASYSKQNNKDYYPLKPVRTRMSEWLRRQIQDLLRKLMGSNPIPRKEFLCSLKTGWWQVRIFRTSAPLCFAEQWEEGRAGSNSKTGLAQSVERGPFKPNVAGSSPAIGIQSC